MQALFQLVGAEGEDLAVGFVLGQLPFAGQFARQ